MKEIKEYDITASISKVIQASSPEEAEDKFWSLVVDAMDDEWNIDIIESEIQEVMKKWKQKYVWNVLDVGKT